jgi:hypothetical protein
MRNRFPRAALRVLRLARAPMALLALPLACVQPVATPVPAARIEALLARAESARELPFRAPVAAQELEAKGVPRLLAQELDRLTPPERLRREEALAKALGFLPEDAELRSLLLSWGVEAVAGFYTPTAGRLYVVKGAAGAGSAEGSGVLVHELAHALQDQHTPLIAVTIGLEGNDDVLFAIGAFLEGDALFTELRDEAETSGFPRPSGAEFAARFEQDAPEGEGVPRLLRESFLRQYPLGYALADELVSRGGVAALTAALDDPPLTSEELIHPERYLERAKRRPLALFPEAHEVFAPECDAIATTSFGELGVAVWLVEAGLPEPDARRAADGWDADRAWWLDCPGDPRLAWLIQLDTLEEAAELHAAVLRARRPAETSRAVLDQEGRRLLLSAGLEDVARAVLLYDLEPRRYDGLRALLRERPDILLRAKAVRDALD